ncbi:hypothetical protein BN7_4248 [Wickerhamomyces ciferrii]|uniref:Altered inheritance of mitochondria protein 36, mitochondrial n=1 Tax=Wickerhamomyces ciferrii (strain ATCC 14091 / BCRC 22168 / CBS 111 / JCM 3599 / NBRC 0793 / NRRL Y-1031 F-60-10) TaxID=1206466 RepID=K0KHJ0_WICCF|nr:uncharacterized protein BN7_4248 [Wickerhamomyces ciferrii]CCH44680.1 hypothetical protein BN7_4248 [Wickerhamomyces ciferrii]
MFRSKPFGIGAFKSSLFPRIKPQSQPLFKRCLSSKNNQPSKDPNKSVRFRNFIAIGIISWVILAQVVEAVNKEQKGSRSMSESEYFKQQMKLKRRKALFTQEEKQVYFVKADKNQDDLKELKLDGFELIDPSKLVEREKNDKESLYNALLNDPDTKTLPTGLLVDLISKELKNNESKKFVVINYPPDIKESVKFEEKAVTIKKLIHLSDDKESKVEDDVLKYYNTVNKVQTIESTEDLIKSLE